MKICLLVFGVFLSSCSDYPANIVALPEIQGVLLSSGKAIKNVQVYVGHSSDINALCQNSYSVSITDENGKFYIPKVMEKDYIPFIINKKEHIAKIINLCFVFNGKQVFGGQIISPILQNASYNITCDKQIKSGRSPMNLLQFCKI